MSVHPATAPDPELPPADDKDWTWVLERPCGECGFDAAGLARSDIAPALSHAAGAMAEALRRPGSAQRPTPGVWSALEYGCHVRDVCRRFGDRLAAMLDQDDPLFENWDQDATAIDLRYWAQNPLEVADEIDDAAGEVAERFAAVRPDQWTRPGRRSNGSRFTVESLGRYFVHDLVHHQYDIAAGGPGAAEPTP